MSIAVQLMEMMPDYLFLLEDKLNDMRGENNHAPCEVYTIEDLAAMESRIAEVRRILANNKNGIYFATPEEIDEARDKYVDRGVSDIEVDEDALVSRSDEGTFVQAWVWLSKPEE